MNCPNYLNCQLIHNKELSIQAENQEIYIIEFCTSTEENWQNCKRYETSLKLKFCPDFVLPDTKLSLDEILDRFDEEINQSNQITLNYGKH